MEYLILIAVAAVVIGMGRGVELVPVDLAVPHHF